MSGRDVFIAGLDRAARRHRAAGARAGGALCGTGRRPRRPRRRSLHGRDLLRPARPRDGGRPQSAPCRRLPIVALMTFDSDGETLAGVSAHTAGERLRSARARRIRCESRRRPGGCAAAPSPRCGATATCSPCCRTSVSRACRGSASSSRTRRRRTSAQFAAQARSLGARNHRRLLWDDARADRRDPRRRSTRTSSRQDRCSSANASSPCTRQPSSEPTQLAQLLGRRHLRRVGAARPAARRQSGSIDRDGEGGARIEQGAVRRRQRQPACARTDERDHGVGRDRALHGHRDDPASHAARHDRRRTGVDPARVARGGRAQHPSRSRAIRPSPATIPAPTRSTTSTRSGSSS